VKLVVAEQTARVWGRGVQRQRERAGLGFRLAQNMLQMAPILDEVGCYRENEAVSAMTSTNADVLFLCLYYAAKKIKADLIEKAKIKKRFFKSIKDNGDNQEGDSSMVDDDYANRDEGKFAPEAREDDKGADDEDILYQMRNRKSAAAAQGASSAKKVNEDKKGGEKQANKWQQAQEKGKKPLTEEGPTLSKEERQRLREQKQEVE
jgi:hypothetical protein